jgi:hypothetical protein
MQISASKRHDWPPSLRFRMQQQMIEANWYGEYSAAFRPTCNIITQQITEVVASALNLEVDEALEEKVRVCLIIFFPVPS